MPCADIRGPQFPTHPEFGNTATKLGVDGTPLRSRRPGRDRTVPSGEDFGYARRRRELKWANAFAMSGVVTSMMTRRST